MLDGYDDGSGSCSSNCGGVSGGVSDGAFSSSVSSPSPSSMSSQTVLGLGGPLRMIAWLSSVMLMSLLTLNRISLS